MECALLWARMASDWLKFDLLKRRVLIGPFQTAGMLGMRFRVQRAFWNLFWEYDDARQWSIRDGRAEN